MSDLKVSDTSTISIPIRNLIAIVFGVATAVWGYFGIAERLNLIERDLDLMTKDVTLNSEFRIKWPRGEFGALPDDARQDMEIEMLKEEVKKLKERTGQWKIYYWY